MVKFLLISLFLLIPSVSWGQTHLTLPILGTDKLVWTHDGLDLNGAPTILTGFRLTIDGFSFNLGIIPKGTGEANLGYGIPLPAMAAGNHIIVVFASNDGGETPSAEFQLIVDPAPVIHYAPKPVANVKVIRK